MVSFPPVSPARPYTPLSPHPYTPHAQPISFFSKTYVTDCLTKDGVPIAVCRVTECAGTVCCIVFIFIALYAETRHQLCVGIRVTRSNTHTHATMFEAFRYKRCHTPGPFSAIVKNYMFLEIKMNCIPTLIN